MYFGPKPLILYLKLPKNKQNQHSWSNLHPSGGDSYWGVYVMVKSRKIPSTSVLFADFNGKLELFE